MNSAYAKHAILSRPKRAWDETTVDPITLHGRELFLEPIQSPDEAQVMAYHKGYIDLPIKPWAFMKGTAESVRVSAVQQAIFDTQPLELIAVRNANLRLPENMHLFRDPQKTEEDMYRLYIYLKNPQAYVASVEKQLEGMETPPHSAHLYWPKEFSHDTAPDTQP